MAARSGLDLDQLRNLAIRRRLSLVIAYGSFPRGDECEGSDLDLAYEETDLSVDPDEFSSLSNKVEVSALRLNSARPELRLACAEEGICLFEASPGTFDRFRDEARVVWEAYRPQFEAARSEERRKAVPLSEVLKRRAAADRDADRV